MKKVLIIGILALGFFFNACEEDDQCLSSDVTGTYAGTKECEERSPVNVTFQVGTGDSDNQIIVDGIGTFIDECDIFGSTIVQGTGREIDGDIDGKRIHFVETIKVNDNVVDRCLWIGDKN